MAADVRKGTLANRIAELKAAGLRWHSGDEQGIHHPLEVFEEAWPAMAPIIEVEPYLYICGDQDEISAEWPVEGVGEVSLGLCIEGLFWAMSVYYDEPPEAPVDDLILDFNTREEVSRWIRQRLDAMRGVQS